MMFAEVVHDAQLMCLIDEGHDALIDIQVLEIAGADLVLHIHQCVAEGVDVVGTHTFPVLTVTADIVAENGDWLFAETEGAH
jgi:hypothetical protein